MEYDWPGNVRELENIIEHAFVLCHGPQIEIEHLPKEFANKFKDGTKRISKPIGRLKETETSVIINALKRHGGNRSKAAQELGIDKSTLWRKIKKYKLKDL
jgi:transcriptional regulator with PAS, ATPase and Fis domain